MTFRQYWEHFLRDPFEFYDTLNLTFRGWDFNIMKESQKMRRVIFWMALFFTVPWAVMGFDSGVGQIEFPVFYVVDSFLNGTAPTWGGIVYEYNWAYGKYMHWSVFTIYGLAFYALSRYYADRHKIEGSRNFAYAFSFIVLSIAVFEYFWMASFYVFQNQPWILWFKYPQSKILIQNFGLTLVGALCILHVQLETEWKLRVDWKTLGAITLAVASCLLWIYYPGHVEPLTVETTTGNWANNHLFPQTVYTIDVDPLDDVNAGEQFYLMNDWVHLANTVAKVCVTLSTVCFGLIVPKEVKKVGNQK